MLKLARGDAFSQPGTALPLNIVCPALPCALMTSGLSRPHELRGTVVAPLGLWGLYQPCIEHGSFMSLASLRKPCILEGVTQKVVVDPMTNAVALDVVTKSIYFCKKN